MIRTRRRAVILGLALPGRRRRHRSLRHRGTGAGPRRSWPCRGQWLQGYVKAVSGDTIVYPWAYPGQTRTLLSRATTGRMSVAWTAEPVPAGRRGRSRDVSLARGHRVGLRGACLHLRHQRHGRGDVPVRQDARRPRVDGDRRGRRHAVVQDDARRHVQRAVRVHVGDGAALAVRPGRPAVLGDRRGRRKPGLLPGPRGAGEDVRARAAGGGGVRGRRARDPGRDQHRARPGGRAHRGRRRARPRPRRSPATRAC